MFQTELADEFFYKASIGDMKLRLVELQESDKEAQKIGAEGLNRYEKLDGVLHYVRLLFVPEIIQTELISQHHNDLLVGHFDINKIKDLVGWKYYWPSL